MRFNAYKGIILPLTADIAKELGKSTQNMYQAPKDKVELMKLGLLLKRAIDNKQVTISTETGDVVISVNVKLARKL